MNSATTEDTMESDSPNQQPASKDTVTAARRSRVGTRLRLLAFVGGGTILLVGTIAWWVGGKLLESTNRSVGDAPHGLPVQNVSFTSDSGTNVAGWLSVVDDSNGVVVLAHPIRGSRLAMVNRANMFRDAGYTTLLIDLQAHGESAGKRITLGHLERHDVRAAVNYSRATFPDQAIIVVGWSLGGAAALLGSPLDVDALVLESVYPEVHRAIHNRLGMRVGALRHAAAPLLLMQLGPRLGVSASDLCPVEFIADVECPVLVLAGTEDQHTTIAESRELFRAAVGPKEMCEFSGASHEDLYRFDEALYRSTVIRFLESRIRFRGRSKTP